MNESIDLSQVDDRDWFLQNLVNMVNARDIELGITLNSGGFLVSGLLVSGKKFFGGLGADLSVSFTDPEVRAGIEQSYAQIGEIYAAGRTGETAAPPNYLHLMQARFFHTGGQPVPATDGVWWRGRISEVSGFFLGVLDD